MRNFARIQRRSQVVRVRRRLDGAKFPESSEVCAGVSSFCFAGAAIQFSMGNCSRGARAFGRVGGGSRGGAALMLLALYARMFALAVQDRVIRLEMQLRMQGVLPANLRARIPEFTLNQLVALRFASDAELPALA